MQKISKESKLSLRSLNMKNIIIALILLVLIFSLVFNILMLNKLSNIPGYLPSQNVVPVSWSSDSITSEQGQEIFLKVNPALEKIRYLRQQIIDREVIKDD